MPPPKTKSLNPGVDRAISILETLEATPGGLSLEQLVRQTDVARSSAYRILNALEARGMVRNSGGVYLLGARILEMASNMARTLPAPNLPNIARPFLEQASLVTGETAKISVREGEQVIVVAGTAGHKDHALQTIVGRYQPLHAGAASKVLLAAMSASEYASLMAQTLTRFTELTMTTLPELTEELSPRFAR